MSRTSVLSALAVAATLATAPVQAGVVFQSGFDDGPDESVLMVVFLPGWTTTLLPGSVDYIRSGEYGILCANESKGCLDMDGTANNAGRIRSWDSFQLFAGVTYTLQAEVSGNQRGGDDDSVLFGFRNTADNTEASVLFSGFTWNQAFGTRSMNFVPVADGQYEVFFHGVGADNVGVILDNVKLSDNTRGGNVPEPASLVLAGLGLLAVGAARRR